MLTPTPEPPRSATTQWDWLALMVSWMAILELGLLQVMTIVPDARHRIVGGILLHAVAAAVFSIWRLRATPVGGMRCALGITLLSLLGLAGLALFRLTAGW